MYSKALASTKEGVRPERASLVFDPATIFLNEELLCPLEIGIANYKHWWFLPYLTWYGIALGRGGFLKTSEIRSACDRLNYSYDVVRQALYEAVKAGYIAKPKRGCWHFRSMATVAKLHGLKIKKTKLGGTRIQTVSNMVIMTKYLLNMPSAQFKGIIIGTAGKALIRKNALTKKMVKRYMGELLKYGFWKNKVWDEETGEEITLKGTFDDLKALSHWGLENYTQKIPLTGREPWYDDIKHHLYPTKRNNNDSNNSNTNNTNLVDFQSTSLVSRSTDTFCESNNIETVQGDSVALSLQPRQHLSLSHCAARCTHIDTLDKIVEKIGYYQTVVTTTPLATSSVKCSSTMMSVGPKQRKPSLIKTTRDQNRFRRFIFSTYGEKEKKRVPPEDLNYCYNVYVHPISNGNLGKAVGISGSTVRNQIKKGLAGVAMNKTIAVLGKFNDKFDSLIELYNENAKKQPHSHQDIMSKMKANTLNGYACSKECDVYQVELTERVNLSNNGQDLLVVRHKSTFIYNEERKMSKSKGTLKGENVKSNCSKSQVEATRPVYAGKTPIIEVSSRSGKENLSVKASPLIRV